MRLDDAAVRRLCAAQGTTLSQLLRDAGVSRTAYYSLRRRESVLPKTVLRLAAILEVPAQELLDDSRSEDERARRRVEAAKRIAGQDGGTKFENVWHTLALLDEPPLERLNRALRRGRAGTV